GIIDGQRQRYRRDTLPRLGKRVAKQLGGRSGPWFGLILPNQQTVITHSTMISISAAEKRAFSRTSIAMLSSLSDWPTRPICRVDTQKPGTVLMGEYRRVRCTSWPIVNDVAAMAAFMASVSMSV